MTRGSHKPYFFSARARGSERARLSDIARVREGSTSETTATSSPCTRTNGSLTERVFSRRPPLALLRFGSAHARENHRLERDIKPELVRQYLSLDQFNAKETNRLNLKQIREGFANHAHDCGGTEVQIAALTEKIQPMTGHLSTHHKDKSSRRGLIAMLERRKKLLKYLRRSNGDSYGEVIYRLGLKDRSFVEDKYVKSNKK